MTSPAADVVGFWHVGITVSDLERSVAFYSDGLGLELHSRAVSSSAASQVWGLPDARADVVYLRIPGSDAMLELLHFHGDVDQRSAAARPWDAASGHFCLLVDDLDGLYEHLSARGYRSRSGGVTVITEGPLTGSKAAYLVDPDGYHVEVFERAG
ncbi:MAG: lactoylglutathione lyase [Pseudonocardiales bacterium]|nr:lactoylglutathione lyase [Pseudonocardiales bacterium]